MITDRGPNGDNPRTFPVPDFTPFIMKVTANEGSLSILQAIPITGLGNSANGVTGLPNSLPPRDEESFDCSGTIQLTPNPHGLDTEGIVHTREGDFWIVEEYGPSILKVDSHGKVLKRFLPKDLNLGITDYAVDNSSLSIPSIFGDKRKINRGFEGIAISPDENSLYVVLQSPLSNPTSTIGNPSRNPRILQFDIRTEQVVGEYVYRFQPAAEFNVPGNVARPQDMKVSGLVMLDQRRMLVLERTDFVAKVYLVDVKAATNILGSKWDDISTSPSLEGVNTDSALEENGVRVLPKELVAILDSTDPNTHIPEKIEGLSVLDGKTIVIANDNDLGVGTFTDLMGSCTLVDTGKKSQLLVIRLDHPLK